MRFVMATKNQKKLAELTRILRPLSIEVLCETDIAGGFPEVEETGASFEENALLKARSAMEATGLPAVADDSGLCVDALGGRPGVFSARYAGEPSGDEANNRKLLEELKEIPSEKRTARFVSAIACIFPDGREFTVRGECEGKIGFTPCGQNGFGYDPLFLTEKGCFAEISAGEKDAISHRGKALRLFAEKLPEYLKS